MAENRNVLEMKRKKLKEELAKDKGKRNQYKIKRLRESIKRHEKIAKDINNKKRRRKAWREKKRYS